MLLGKAFSLPAVSRPQGLCQTDRILAAAKLCRNWSKSGEPPCCCHIGYDQRTTRIRWENQLLFLQSVLSSHWRVETLSRWEISRARGRIWNAAGGCNSRFEPRLSFLFPPAKSHPANTPHQNQLLFRQLGILSSREPRARRRC